TSLPSYCRNSKKLTILNYEPLLNQVKSKVASKRLLLVNTVIAGITNLQLTDEEDTYTVNGSNWNKYNTGSIYKELKNHAPLVQWYNTIWFYDCQSHTKKLLLIAWKCAIYLLWTERNSRLHRRCFRSPTSLLSTLNLTFRKRWSSLRSHNTVSVSAMIQMWLR
ncbi:LOW QUALITY PROTEIN: hypothetical protein HID58_065935, partial [Brassica napus]